MKSKNFEEDIKNNVNENEIVEEKIHKIEKNKMNKVEDMYSLLNNTVSVEEDNYKIVKNINQNKNIISNVSQTQLDTIQGKNYNHCK